MCVLLTNLRAASLRQILLQAFKHLKLRSDLNSNLLKTLDIYILEIVGRSGKLHSYGLMGFQKDQF